VSLDRQQQLVPASSAAQSSAMVAGPPWGEYSSLTSLQRWETDSRCSFATDATWESLVSTDDEGSIAIEAETVFDMTGQTGSSLYIAPEVFHGQPYNEKADVFSFGVVLYELMARCLIMFTELPACSSDPQLADHYAAKVAKGYRPKQPKKMPPAAWELIAACWHQDPVHRPHMSEVVSVLQDLLDAERGPGSRGKSSASRPSLGQDPGAPAALAPAASSLQADSAPPMAGSAASLTSSLQIVSHVAASPAQQHGSMRPADDAGQCPSSKPVSAGCSCVIC
jgi:serine/threonine protein kinase